MATQGLITITNTSNEVTHKIIAGCNGFNIDSITLEGIKRNINNIRDLYYYAISQNFGCLDCLVVSYYDKKTNSIKQYHNCDDDEITLESIPLYYDLYYNKFNDASFNPRWKNGTVAHYNNVVIR